MRLTVLAALLLLILGGSVRSESETICVEDPDYVTLASVVASYGLSTSAYSGNEELSATGGSSSLTVRADSRQALINGVRHWLSYPVRQAEGGLAISRVDVTRTLAPALRPEAVSGLRPVTTVVLDAGHGGHDRGALSAFGDEKDFALDVVGRVRRKLRAAGLRVVQSRELGRLYSPRGPSGPGQKISERDLRQHSFQCRPSGECSRAGNLRHRAAGCATNRTTAT